MKFSHPCNLPVHRAGAVLIYSNFQWITLQLRPEVPVKVDLAASSFKAAVALTSGDALSIAGESQATAAAQLKS